ncbi:hypothetical protein KGF56_004830 [Candida oxycetoniae]|uniref:Uncharacterized protein n=1 Tax=Candida oxycetoniae TaxID=497107 RepID=A0AAI9WW65_9ASCO|nr:uncharacterized protein KGF56_004830 [Candida oxycetoniae]KAI3402422.2 hypothetical protein KGF56_004830 [Candida oxycetoniae]
MAPPSPQEQFILIITALVLPPLAIFLAKKYSVTNKEFLISLVLTLFGHVPGSIFSVYYLVCIDFPSYTRLPDAEETPTDNEGDNHPSVGVQEQRLHTGKRVKGSLQQQPSKQHQQQQQQQKQQQQQPYRDEVSSAPQTSTSSKAPLLGAGGLPSYHDVVHSNQDNKVSDNKTQH